MPPRPIVPPRPVGPVPPPAAVPGARPPGTRPAPSQARTGVPAALPPTTPRPTTGSPAPAPPPVEVAPAPETEPNPDASRLTLQAALSDQLYAPDFFHLCRLLDTAYPQLPRLGTSMLPSEDVIRFSQEPSLAFAPVTIPRFMARGEARGGRIYVNFMGLLGPHGPLPLHMTDYARDRERNAGDSTIARFFDIFNHRMISLFYRAWAVNHMTTSADRPSEDRYAIYTGSLFGLGMPSLIARDAVPDHAKLHYAGRLSHQTRNAEGLESIVRGYFGIEAQIVEFIGRWLDLPERYWCRIGARSESSRLGVGAVAGRRVWDVQSCVRIRLGPMGLKDYCRMLPGGSSHQRLGAWVRNYIGMELDFETQLVLKQDHVPMVKLGGEPTAGARLGWTTWLRTGDLGRDGDDLVTLAERVVEN